MTQKEAKARFARYLKSHFIEFHESTENGVVKYRMTYKNYELCPEHKLESCVWFFPDHMQACVYYSIVGAELCKESEHKSELMRLLNYINAMVWPVATDGKEDTVYKPHVLYAPRIFMMEDETFDIMLAFPVNYTFYEAAPIETEDFITACCPDLMDSLAFAIFGLLLGTANLEQAIAYVQTNILVEDM